MQFGITFPISKSDILKFHGEESNYISKLQRLLGKSVNKKEYRSKIKHQKIEKIMLKNQKLSAGFPWMTSKKQKSSIKVPWDCKLRTILWV